MLHYVFYMNRTKLPCLLIYYSHKSRRQMIRVNTLFKFVCYNTGEDQIITTGTDRKVGYWESYDGSMIRELEGSLSGSVNTMDISTDGTYFVSGGDDKLIKVRDCACPVFLAIKSKSLCINTRRHWSDTRITKNSCKAT